MKLNFSSNTVKNTISNIIVLSVAIILYFVIKNISIFFVGTKEILRILMPFVYGFAIAYILDIPMKVFERTILKPLDKKGNLKLKRTLAITITYILAGIIIAIVIAILIPELARSIGTLIENIPDYAHSLEVYFTEIVTKLNLDANMVNEIIEDFNSISGYITSIGGAILGGLLQFSAGITQSVLNVFIATIISIYMLASKERFFAQVKKLLFAVLPQKPVNYLIELSDHSNKTFKGFLSGKLLDSLIIAIICFVCMNIFNMPYTLLVSFIIGMTNIVPVFGPFIGAIPSVIIIFITSPIKALWFILFVFLLQQFDGNILGPKILGNSTGLSAFWVMFAILLGNGLFGFIGMIIGVPAFAVIYSIVRGAVEINLEKKGMPTETKDYASSDQQIID
ncbi:AI-2E family transporter [Clostridium culturomicium]|uniref:AI-2E family transporter n=1 Tax=Clostridium culturomicium TaxID=1499683 RepID=UPI00058B46A2|nr:AI-2E family transporter [Clostridium culturomicium]